MKTANIFHVTDWNIKSFLALIAVLQVVMICTLVLQKTEIHISPIQSLIGFVYLTFIPGVLILRILRIHHLSSIEMLLYSVGLSISNIMFLGFFINVIYPLLGIMKPFAPFNVILTITGWVLILMVVAYYRDRDFSTESLMDPQFLWSPSALFLLLLPLMAVIGAFLVNYYHSNLILMLLILLIAVSTVLIGFDKFIPSKLYPFAIFIFAISLLLHRSLVPGYLWGADIQLEYYFSNLVLNNGIWAWTVTHPYNGVLSTNMVAPVYSIFCNMDIRWIFKTVYQFFYALVPLALYAVFKKQTNSKIAFFACFFFIALSTFYSEMPALARQEVAELFLVILILLYFNKAISSVKTAFLIILFIFSLITSHYALSYIYMFIFGLTWVLIYIIEKYDVWKVYLPKKNFFICIRSWLHSHINPKIFKGESRISLGYVLLFVVFTVAWYMYIASSASFEQVVHIGGQISGDIFREFLDPATSQGLFILTSKTTSLLYSVSKVLLLVAQIFILIGLFSIIFSTKRTKFQRDYLYFSMINLLLLGSLILVPLFASSLNTTRLYHISLIFLAPYCIIGGIITLKQANKYLPVFNIKQCVKYPLKILSIFLVMIFLFSSGFIYEVAQEHPNSGSLSQNWIENQGSPEEKVSFYSGYTPEQNIYSAKWLALNRNRNHITIYSGFTNSPQINSVMTGSFYSFIIKDLSNLTADYTGSYIYLGYIEVHDGIVGSGDSVFIQKTLYINLSQIQSRINKTDRIYDNGNSEIYYGINLRGSSTETSDERSF